MIAVLSTTWTDFVEAALVLTSHFSKIVQIVNRYFSVDFSGGSADTTNMKPRMWKRRLDFLEHSAIVRELDKLDSGPVKRICIKCQKNTQLLNKLCKGCSETNGVVE